MGKTNAMPKDVRVAVTELCAAIVKNQPDQNVLEIVHKLRGLDAALERVLRGQRSNLA